MTCRRIRAALACIAVAGSVLVSTVSAQAAGLPEVTILDAPRVVAVPMLQVSAYGAVWVLSETELDGNPHEYTAITKIDKRTGKVVAKLNLGYDSVGANYYPQLTAGARAIWTVDYNSNQLIKIDPATDRVLRRVRTGLSPDGVVFAAGSVWVAHQHTSAVWRYNPHTLRVTRRVPAGDTSQEDSGLALLSAGDGAVWVDELFQGKVQRIDTSTYRVRTIDVSPSPSCGFLVFVPGGFWLDDDPCGSTVYHYDLATKTVDTQIDFPTYCAFPIDYRAGSLWATFAPKTDPDTGDCVGGRVARYNPQTGARTALRRAPGAGPLIVLRDHTMWFGNFHFMPPLRRRIFHASTF